MANQLRLLLPLIFSLCTLSIHAQWVKTNGLPGGKNQGFLAYGDTVLVQVGSEHYYSADHGQSWSNMPFHPGVWIGQWSYSDGQTILGGRNDPSTGSRLVRSDDFGQTWQAIASTDTMYFYEILLANGYIYGSDYNGLYRSNDNGANWEYLTQAGISNIQFDGQRITGSRYPYLLQSTDQGFTWDTLLQVSASIAELLQHENHLFAFMRNAGQGCYVSNDFGQTWQQYPGFEFEQFYEFIWLNGNIHGLSGDLHLKSSDLGQTWDTIPLPAEYYEPAYRGIAVGSDLLIGGVFNPSSSILRSTDEGVSWSPSIQGIKASAGKLRTINNALYAPSPGGLYQLAPDGQNWTELPIAIPTNNHFGIKDFAISNGKWVITTEDELGVSPDNGTSWIESSVILSNWWDLWSTRLESIADQVVSVMYESHFYEFYTSFDHGLTFTSAQQPPSRMGAADFDQGKIYALCIDKKLYRSDDVGNQWVQHGITIPASIGSINDASLIVRGNVIAISPYSDSKMLFSNDAGQNWTFYDLATAGLPIGDSPFRDLLYVGNFLVGANNNGIYLSQNDGTDWIPWNEDLEAQNITDIEVFEDHIWAATEGNGIWKRPLSELGIHPVTGIVFFDPNGNAQQDPGEPGLPNVVTQSLITNAYTNTQADGSYRLHSNFPQEEIKITPQKPYWILTPASQTVAVPSAGANFAVEFDPNAQDLSVDFTNVSVLRPGFETNYLLSWRNHFPIAAANVVLTLSYPDNLLDLLSASIPPTTQSGGSLSWDLGNLAPLTSGSIVLQFRVPATVPLDTEVCATATINPLIGDLAPDDNTHERCETVVGAFDPNDKHAEPSDFISPAQLANNEPINYTIRFQNTGNYPAKYVRILDTLQPFFDPATFQFLSASHPCTWTIREQGIVEFLFNNIQLPPITTDEPGSHGFVKYRINPRPNLSIGTDLRNTAHIFFDFNAPITTNTVSTVVGTVNSSEALAVAQRLVLSPNPSSRMVRVETGGQAGELILQDATGKLVLRILIENEDTMFSVEALPQGLYHAVFVGEKTIQRGSLVIQR
jgi:uncharacterized repeat protein (TIGR01451 family)